MVTLQNDLLEIYNNLTEFSKAIFESKNPVPIKVKFDRNAFESPLVFEARGITVRLRLPIYYCLGLEDLEKETYLLPGDYDMMMESLQKAIYDPRTLDERTCIAPENYGFNIYALDKNRFDRGLEELGRVRFVSGTSWIFRKWIKWKYKGQW